MKGLALLVVLLCLAFPATALGASATEIATELRKNPVYSERGAEPGLSQAGRGDLAVQIARQDTGRIKIAVVPSSVADAAGGTGPLANAIAGQLSSKGNLIVVAGSSAYLVTSYPQVEPAKAALSKGFEDTQGEPLEKQLSAGVEGIAKADPGPSSDVGRQAMPDATGVPEFKDATDSVVSTVKLVLLIVGIAIALPFVIGAGWLLLRARRRRRDEAELLAEERDGFRDEMVALGDQIRELDLDVSMPNADPAGRAEYERAVEIYDHANAALTERRGAASLQRARAALSEGQQRMARARALLEAQQPAGPVAPTDG
jgi:hypothetical protein